MALGAVAIGYADESITRAVQEAAAHGNVSALPHRLEVEVAERLIEVIPCAEQVRFLRTGAEATAAAVRIARTATARDHVIACGYFGWLDWCSDSIGVPAGARADVSTVPFDDVEALDAAVAEHGTELAAVIIEPLIERIASVAWLRAARMACDRVGAVLIFDEIKTAFRVRTGGVQALHAIEPDLTTLGKALANGYPLSAVVGRADIMAAATNTWISSTAASESTGLAAARAVLDWHDRVDVCQRLKRIGESMQQEIGGALAQAPWVAVTVDGPAQMWRLVTRDPQHLDDLVAATAHEGVLLKRGAYQFASLAHDEATVDTIARAVSTAARKLEPKPRRPEA
jgi:glutamate-1-semialdehyde 2,1-aminomutase